MSASPVLTAQVFNAESMFGGFSGYEPGAAAFNAAVIDSVSEFDGQSVTEALVASINARILALQAVASELIAAERDQSEFPDFYLDPMATV